MKPQKPKLSPNQKSSRREFLQQGGALVAASGLATGMSLPALAANDPPKQTTDLREDIFVKVWNTPLVDTHEHLFDERDSLSVKDDWTVVLSGYLGADLLSAGMPPALHKRFYAQGPSPGEKWKILAPYWPAVKNSGYAQAARISLRELYGVEELGADTVDKAQAGFMAMRRPGFYRKILCELAKIESCQVNWPYSSNNRSAQFSAPFHESDMPALLMQDLSLNYMFAGPPDLRTIAKPTGIAVANLSDWHKVIDWWFKKYGPYAVAVKTQDAYRRQIDYKPTPAKKVAKVFKKKVDGQAVTSQEQKSLEDHLFWYAVRKASECNLPVKLHTGYFATTNSMPLSRLRHNAASGCDLCRVAPATRFVFMHICYPYYEELIAVAKQYTNAYVDMCWAWIINPLAAKDFLKKYLVTAPANKIFTFGGDFLNVEQVLGHAIMARQGIALALCELVEEGWLSLADAIELVDPIMRGNARHTFRLDEKEQTLHNAF
jgi:uncharacterized protein